MSRNLVPGTTIPDFALPDENGTVHRLSELQGDNLLVLHLSRGEHCPRERLHHRELLRFHEWCSVAFTELVSVLPNVLHDVHKLKISTGAHWTFLADEELELQRHFDIKEYTDPHHANAGVPHTLILSPGLVLERVYVGYWFWGRPSVERLWDDLGEVLRRTKADFDPTTATARAAWQAGYDGAPAGAAS
jgi:peroxiredoxin